MSARLVAEINEERRRVRADLLRMATVMAYASVDRVVQAKLKEACRDW